MTLPITTSPEQQRALERFYFYEARLDSETRLSNLNGGDGVQREIAIAGHDHQSNLLALCNDLVIGLQIKFQIIEPPRFQRFALGQ